MTLASKGFASSATAILLAGGKGTRIASIRPDVPKPMIEVAGRPFVEWVIEQFAASGVRRFLISLGHLAHVAESHFEAHRAGFESRGLRVDTLVERDPLGTGGAVAFAWDSLSVGGDRPPVIASNADSLVLADPAPMLAALDRVGPGAPVASLLGVRVPDISRFGSVDVDADTGRLRAFNEKDPSRSGSGLINAGVYAFTSGVRDAFPGDPGAPAVKSSLEHDVFPGLVSRGVSVTAVDAPFIDIGTPDSLAGADGWLNEHLGSGAVGDLGGRA